MTKILAISDVHGEENENLYTYLENSDIDLMLILGDITNFGPLDFVETFINKLKNFDLDFGNSKTSFPCITCLSKSNQ